jgi:hypothetical protein
MKFIHAELKTGDKAVFNITEIQAVVQNGECCEVWVKECPDAIALDTSFQEIVRQLNDWRWT